MNNIKEIKSSDGYTLKYYVWNNDAAKDVIFLIHGFMSHSMWLKPQMEALNNLGYKVVGIERRGAGINRENLGDAPSAQQLLDDHEIVINEESEGKNIYIIGWCLGAVIAINYVHSTKKQIKGIILSAPSIFPQESLIKRAIEIGAHPIGEYSEKELPLAIQESDFTQGPLLYSFILKDENRIKSISSRFYEIQKKMSQSAWVKVSTKKVNTPMLVILAKRDLVVDNKRTEDVFSSLRNCHIEYIDAGHGIQFEKGEEFVEVISSWLNKLEKSEI